MFFSSVGLHILLLEKIVYIKEIHAVSRMVGWAEVCFVNMFLSFNFPFPIVNCLNNSYETQVFKSLQKLCNLIEVILLNFVVEFYL